MRKALSLLIKAGVSGLLFFFALGNVDIELVRNRLGDLDVRWIGVGLLLLAVQLFVLALRWNLIVAACGAQLTSAKAFRFTMIGAFFNQTLPSSVGGDAMRVWLLGKQANWRVAIYSVLLDRVIGVVALALIVVACLPWTLALVRNPVGRIALLTIGLGAVAAGCLFVGVAWRRLSILQRWSPTRHLAAAATIAVSILRSPRTAATIFGVSIAIHVITATVAWCAARAVGAELSLAYSLFLVLPVVLVSVVPISIAGWGVRESAMVAAFGYAGLPQSDGLLVSLLFGAGTLVIGALGGLLWVLSSDRHTFDVAVLPAADQVARIDGTRDTIG